MTSKVVFDVNILVSAVAALGGAPARALQAALEQEWDIVGSAHIVQKLIEVLSRPRFSGRLSNSALNAFLREYQHYAVRVVPDPSVSGVGDDAEDDLVLGTAVAANSGYLVMGDKGLLQIGEYRRVRIVDATGFLDILKGRVRQEE